MRYACGECLATTEYEPKYDGDFPDGWFGLENKAWYAPLCSGLCVVAYVNRFEEPQPVDAVDPHAAI